MSTSRSVSRANESAIEARIHTERTTWCAAGLSQPLSHLTYEFKASDMQELLESVSNVRKIVEAEINRVISDRCPAEGCT